MFNIHKVVCGLMKNRYLIKVLLENLGMQKYMNNKGEPMPKQINSSYWESISLETVEFNIDYKKCD